MRDRAAEASDQAAQVRFALVGCGRIAANHFTALGQMTGVALHNAKVQQDLGHLNEELRLRVERITQQKQQIQMLQAELTAHLGYEKGDPAGRGRGNSRNGSSAKTVLTEDGEVEIAVPRDRAGSFEPQLIARARRTSTASTTRF